MSKSAKFDRDEVIDKATNLYWEKGFHGTSMRNLQDVVDMRPGSIYATFGSKENLFREALQHYADMSVKLLSTCKKEASSPLDTLKLFMKKAILDGRESAPSSMCMLVKTVSELTDENAELLAEAKRLLKRVENAFAEIIKEAIAEGELNESKDPLQLAQYIQIQVMGLRTYARVAGDAVVIENFINDIFESSLFRN